MKILNKKFLTILLIFLITGSVAWFVYQYQQQEPENITGSPPDSEQDLNSTSTLKTYRSEDWGFEFRYPENLGVYYPGSVTFSALNIGLGSLYSQRPHPIIVEVLLDNQIKWKQKSLKENIISITEKKAGGIKGEEYTRLSGGVLQIDYLFPREGFWIAIGGRGEYKEILGQMIESFKFWEPEPRIVENTDDTKTYRSQDWGFEFRYPADWQIRQPAFGSAVSMFNLVVHPSNEKYLPDPVRINILPNDWIERVRKSFKREGIKSFDVRVDEISGIGYEHISEGLPQLDFFLPRGDYWIVIGGKKKYEDILNQVVASFKFFSNTDAETKTYRNEEYGFEFQYPEDWGIEENSVRTVSSKFNLILTPIGEPYQPLSPILLNIVTPDFGDYTFQNLDKVVSEINIGGIVGERYDYKLGNMQRMSILLPLNDLRVILGAGKGYEDVFNQILASFKFLK